LGTFLIEEPEATLVPTWDGGRKVARLELADTPAEPVGPVGDHTAIWRRVADDANVALCAELVGAMEQAHHLAVEYAKVRVQFGRPIATFQAIKHKAVDMLHRLELARVGTHYAAWASDADEPVRAEAVAMAKGFVPEAANFVCAESIQIHGGVGFTWDCDAHLFYRRAKQNDLLLGYQGWSRERLADVVLAG
jgi:alkylation response protein AidB-like acyl-CoA dehydrogenase